ncbi:MAG: ion channel [Pseudomonadota bacterium]
MLAQLLIGSVVISATILVEALFFVAAERALRRMTAWMLRPPQLLRAAILLVAVTLWLMTAHSIGVWFWAATFLHLDVFDALEPAVYFSVVAFTTLGFGDVLLDREWRILGGLAAANGLLIFGLSTAFLVEFLRQLRQAQARVVDRES